MVYGGGNTYWYTGYKYTAPDYQIVISKTTNNGTSWTRYTLSSGSDYRYARALAVDPNDSDRVYALVYESSAWKVYFTLDGGGTWQSVNASGWAGTPYRLVVNPSDGTHLAAASSSGLYASTNGGASWTRVTTAFGSSTDAVISSDGLSLVVGTSTQGIWKWENWTGAPVLITTTPSAITTLYDSPNLYLYAGTPASSVWRSYYGTGTHGSSSAAVPGFALSVHPNPASSGMASVSFSLPSTGVVSISLFDVTGRLAGSVSCQLLSEGAHSVPISTASLSPGVYFARLEHLGESSTVRMVVTR